MTTILATYWGALKYPVVGFVVHAVGSYYATQLVGNVLVTATAMHSCTSSALGFKSLQLIYVLALLGINVIGSNLLCHRYLHEKATVMVKM